jgi:hypothetical protein
MGNRWGSPWPLRRDAGWLVAGAERRTHGWRVRFLRSYRRRQLRLPVEMLLCCVSSYASAGTGSRLGVTVSVVRSVGRGGALGRAPCLVIQREGMRRPRGRHSRRRIASVPVVRCSGCRRERACAPRSRRSRWRGVGITVWSLRLVSPVVAKKQTTATTTSAAARRALRGEGTPRSASPAFNPRLRVEDNG